MKKTFPEDRVNIGVNKITPYQPGKSSDSLNISKEKLIKLASNENPIGPSKLATKAISHPKIWEISGAVVKSPREPRGSLVA